MKRRVLLLPIAAILLSACNEADDNVAEHDEAHDGPMMNYVRIDDRLVTGGHFVDNGIDVVQTEGVEVVIDLRDEPPEGHRERIEAQGLTYINVPVLWRAPERSDFESFREAMAEHDGKHVLVQCQANYRASAFTYMYRVLDGGVEEADARVAMNEIWEPEGEWQEYIEGILGD